MVKPRWVRCRWQGDLPRPGHFMKAERGRKAFEICAIEPWPDSAYPYRIKVLPWALSEVPDHAVIHPFVWDRRK